MQPFWAFLFITVPENQPKFKLMKNVLKSVSAKETELQQALTAAPVTYIYTTPYQVSVENGV